ncbi:hypothetical protein HZS_7145 [Henneguya salminicola]|nr:hypothetical protein HZS_7145 [Henneguya salminicola]
MHTVCLSVLGLKDSWTWVAKATVGPLIVMRDGLQEDVRLQLAHEDFSKLDQFSLRADAIWQAKSTNFNVSALKTQLKNRCFEYDKKPYLKNLGSASALCFSHKKFGSEAKKCRLPSANQGEN